MLKLTVTDVNEAPQFTKDVYKVKIAENSQEKIRNLIKVKAVDSDKTSQNVR